MSAVVAALVGAVVALVVAAWTARVSRTSWVLDRRHDAYLRAANAATELLGAVWLGDQNDRIADRAKVEVFTAALSDVMLVGPQNIRDRCNELVEVARVAHRDGGRHHDELFDRANDLLEVLWEDLIPPRMRVGRTRRPRRSLRTLGAGRRSPA